MPKPITVFITGCSSGVGYELLKIFNREPYLIIGTARGASLAKLLADPLVQCERIVVKELNVKNYRQSSELLAWVHKTYGSIDILINNAGVSYRSAIEDMTPEDEQRQMEINYLGPLHLIREALPKMRKNRRGHIINVSSVGGMMAMPTMASYSASKFALEGASEALWYELKPWNIHVSLVRPGFINSHAFKKVAFSQKRLQAENHSAYEAHYENMERFVAKMMTSTPCTSTDVARRIFKIARRKKPPLRVAGTPDASVFQMIRWILPRFIYHNLLYWFLPGIRNWGKNVDRPK